MNVNFASANMAQQYANNLQSTSPQVRVPEQVQQEVQNVVPEEPSRQARPVQEVNDTPVGRNVDVYV